MKKGDRSALCRSVWSSSQFNLETLDHEFRFMGQFAKSSTHMYSIHTRVMDDRNGIQERKLAPSMD